MTNCRDCKTGPGELLITFNSSYNTRSADILQDLHVGWDSLKQKRSKQLAISVFKSLDNLYPEGLKNKLCLNQPPGFIHITNQAFQTMFLYPGPVVKLLRGRLATGGCHVERPR